jgi:hypothetical protein
LYISSALTGGGAPAHPSPSLACIAGGLKRNFSILSLVWQIWQLSLSAVSVEEDGKKRMVKRVNTKIRFIVMSSFSMNRIDIKCYHGKNIRARMIFTFTKSIGLPSGMVYLILGNHFTITANAGCIFFHVDRIKKEVFRGDFVIVSLQISRFF